MLAPILRAPPQQRMAASLGVLAEALDDAVNLAVWQRELSGELRRFVCQLLARERPWSSSLMLEPDVEGHVDLSTCWPELHQLPGYPAFSADIAWLVAAFSCLLGARRIGLRIRSLAQPMCPRWHVDHVPLRLISTYHGAGSEWLCEGAMDRRRLGDVRAEPSDTSVIQSLQAGWVALAKGEKWLGNEGAGLIHRSPVVAAGEKRLLLSIDWLA